MSVPTPDVQRLQASASGSASSCAEATPPCFTSVRLSSWIRDWKKGTDLLQRVWGAVLMGCSQETVIMSLLMEMLFMRRVWQLCKSHLTPADVDSLSSLGEAWRRKANEKLTRQVIRRLPVTVCKLFRSSRDTAFGSYHQCH